MPPLPLVLVTIGVSLSGTAQSDSALLSESIAGALVVQEIVAFGDSGQQTSSQQSVFQSPIERASDERGLVRPPGEQNRRAVVRKPTPERFRLGPPGLRHARSTRVGRCLDRGRPGAWRPDEKLTRVERNETAPADNNCGGQRVRAYRRRNLGRLLAGRTSVAVEF